jgi:hypothetical protein
MESRDNHQFDKLDSLLCTSFNNVKYDVRQLNLQLEELRKQVLNLSISSLGTVVKDQARFMTGFSTEQEKALNLLKEDILALDKQLASVQLNQLRVNEPIHETRHSPQTSRSTQILQELPAIEVRKKSVYDLGEGIVRITKSQFKSPKKNDINGEWVEITGYDVDMTGFALHDKAKRHIYRFPAGFHLYGPVKLFTGKGKDTNTKLFWGQKKNVWNNDYDIATLRDKSGRIISQIKSEAVHDFVILK